MPRRTPEASRGVKGAAPRSGTPAAAEPGEAPLFALAQQVRSWADTLLSVTGKATDLGLTLAQARTRSPRGKAALAKAGSELRRLRETAGLTARELGEAVGLGESSLIEDAEAGLSALPFEVVLRLAGVLGRHDPIPVAMALTRQYNPTLWKTLESLGVGKLAVQGARERELANVYRANDAARRLDDARFARVLQFTKQAFDMAVEFGDEPRARARPKRG